MEMTSSLYLFGSIVKPSKLKIVFLLPPNHSRLLSLVRFSESSSVQSNLSVEPNTIMSSCTINKTASREQQRIITAFTYIMYYVQDYSILYNKVVRPVLCEGSHFTHNCKQLLDPIIPLRGLIQLA